MEFTDKTLTCIDCGQQFTFTVREQELYQSHEPKRCPECEYSRRRERKGGSGSSRASYPATCAACGKEITVPFERSEERPVYCSECYAEMKEDEERRHDEKTASKEELGNLHEKERYSRYSNDTTTTINDNRVIYIILIVIGVFAIVAPWYKYIASPDVLWLIISILLSIIFFPSTTIWVIELAKPMKLHHLQRKNELIAMIDEALEEGKEGEKQ